MRLKTNSVRCSVRPGRYFVAWLAAVLVVALVVVYVSALCWDYSVSFWLVQAGKPDNFGFWHGVGISCVPGIGQLSMPIAGATFAASFFL